MGGAFGWCGRTFPRTGAAVDATGSVSENKAGRCINAFPQSSASGTVKQLRLTPNRAPWILEPPVPGAYAPRRGSHRTCPVEEVPWWTPRR